VTLGVATATTRAVGEGVGPEVSAARPVQLVATPVAAKPGVDVVDVVQDCPGLGTAEQCFTPPPDPSTGRYLNVASFFDRRQRSMDGHFFLKFYDNAAGAVVDINGLGMHVDYNQAGIRTLAAVGVLKTSRSTPLLPAVNDLRELQAVDVVAEPGNVETCVEFDEAIRIAADEAAWLVVRFPPAGESAFIGLLVDEDATDLDCDFMTPDAGEYYYRPDPRNGPAFDWAITAYTTAVVNKDLLSEIHWSQVKQLYRDTESASAR
jgi:hypothetical protein